eukprot:GHUV01050008.1.p1 GENE.GHUV01050008.1~~GHUV01050008.1.p1  ORF type:complete len:129 (-),score=27.24 GHUV01050008.1:297-650(-)
MATAFASLTQTAAGCVAKQASAKGVVRPFAGKAPVKVVASARHSSFTGNAAFTAAAKQSVRGMRAAARRSAVMTRAKLGDSLAEFLVEATPDTKLRQLLMSMSEALRTIAFKVSVVH